MTKRRFILGSIAATLLVCSLLWWWIARPLPLESAFEQIQPGLSRHEAEAIVALPDMGVPHNGQLRLCIWEGPTPEGMRRVWNDDFARLRAAPTVSKAGILRDGEVGKVIQQGNVFVYRDRQTGALQFSEQVWRNEREMLLVHYDTDGLVREKLYFQCRGDWTFVESLRRLWPF